MLGKRPHQIQRTTSMSQLRPPPSARIRPPSLKDHIIPTRARTPADALYVMSNQETPPEALEIEIANPHADAMMLVHLPGHLKVASPSLPLKVTSTWMPPPLLPKPAVSESFLDACYSCQKPLGHGRDIFMYRGDAAFCSEDCRLRLITYDERKQKFSVSPPQSTDNRTVVGSTDIASPSGAF